MDNPETHTTYTGQRQQVKLEITEEETYYGQSRDTYNIEYTRHSIKTISKRQRQPEEETYNGQSRDTYNIEYTRHRAKTISKRQRKPK